MGYRQVFASPGYRRFWLGFTVSALGDSMSQTALVWFVYSSSSGSPTAVGALTFAYSAPILIGGLLAGPLLDRFDRRRVMLADNLVRAAAFAAIPILHWAGALALWHVYVRRKSDDRTSWTLAAERCQAGVRASRESPETRRAG